MDHPLNRHGSSSVSSNDQERNTILSQRTHHALIEKSASTIKNIFQKTGSQILELSRFNVELDKLNYKISKIDVIPKEFNRLVSKASRAEALNKKLDRMLERLKPFQ
jgi:hypothetical protein